MTILLLPVVGRLLALTPEPLLRIAAAFLGEAVLWVVPGRKRLILSNLAHAFPGRPAAWRRKMARASSRRMIETGMLSLASAYLSADRIRRMVRLTPAVEAWLKETYGGGSPARPTVLATFHLALWESQTWFPLIVPVALPEFGIIFRPLANAPADAYVKRTRERFGMRLLSRKEGFASALRILRQGGCVGILVDQNAGPNGAMTLFFDRLCSTTELPGVLAAKFHSGVRTIYLRRTGFWRGEFESQPVAHDGTAEGITLALNQCFEAALTADENLCASWLWAHDRWRHQDIPRLRFHYSNDRDLLPAEVRRRGLAALPRRTRLWVRLPNWLGDVVIALPLLRALRAGRPDMEINLLAKPGFLPLLETLGVADRLHALPPGKRFAWRHFLGLRRAYPDLWLLFTNSFRGDLEAWLAGAPQRFGIRRKGKPRPLLTDAYRLPADFDERKRHQAYLWESFLRHFGLEVPVDLSPFVEGAGAVPNASGTTRSTPDANPPTVSTSGKGERVVPDALSDSADEENPPIGLIPGSENNPEKRWPVERWRELIRAVPGHRFVLFGTAGDRPITAAIAGGYQSAEIEDLAGKTDLVAYAERLRRCRLLVTNDTGGMHLANALGVPVIALFGPTNPVRTGPIFNAPSQILQPPNSPNTGGRPLSELSSALVADAVRRQLESPCLSST